MKPAYIILAIFISMIWGINFVVAKATLSYMPPFFLLACRLMLVSAILLPFLRKPALPLSNIFYISITLTVAHFGLMYMALGFGLDSSVAVVIDQMRVPFAVIFGYFILGESISKKVAFGIMLALIGTFIITGAPNVSDNYYPMWMMIGAAASWAFYNIQVKNLKDVHMLSFIGWVSLFGAPQLFIISAMFESGQVESLFVAPITTTISLIYMAIFVTIIGHGSWYYLLQKHPVSHVVPYSLLTPIFGMVTGVIFLQEALTWQIILGALFTIGGVAIIVTTRRVSNLKKIERM
jgi:O-acetylserine/cysteine efflux transporter